MPKEALEASWEQITKTTQGGQHDAARDLSDYCLAAVQRDISRRSRRIGESLKAQSRFTANVWLRRHRTWTAALMGTSAQERWRQWIPQRLQPLELAKRTTGPHSAIGRVAADVAAGMAGAAAGLGKAGRDFLETPVGEAVRGQFPALAEAIAVALRGMSVPQRKRIIDELDGELAHLIIVCSDIQEDLKSLVALVPWQILAPREMAVRWSKQCGNATVLSRN